MDGTPSSLQHTFIRTYFLNGFVCEIFSQELSTYLRDTLYKESNLYLPTNPKVMTKYPYDYAVI